MQRLHSKNAAFSNKQSQKQKMKTHHRRPWIRAWRKKEMHEGRGREEHEILCYKRALKSEV